MLNLTKWIKTHVEFDITAHQHFNDADAKLISGNFCVFSNDLSLKSYQTSFQIPVGVNERKHLLEAFITSWSNDISNCRSKVDGTYTLRYWNLKYLT